MKQIEDLPPLVFLEQYLRTQHFQSLLKKAGLPAIRFHDLRHSVASSLLLHGVHPKVVQEILGHSQISMTMDFYSHVLPTMHDDAMEKLNQAFMDQNRPALREE